MSGRLAPQAKPTAASNPPTSSGPIRLLQRKCACGGSSRSGGECEECRKKRLQRKSTGAAAPSEVPSIVHDVLRSPGQPLDAAARGFFEPRFGHDFGDVRVHTDTDAARSARAVNALAYTVGRDVVFDSGQYAPRLQSGQQLLAHELAHVVQQGSADRGPSIAIGDPALEAPATAAAEAVIRGARPIATQRAARGLSRQEATRPESATEGPEPKSLRATVAIKEQSDEWLVREIELIRAWMDRRTSSSRDEERLLGTLSEAGTVLLNRHPDILKQVQDSLKAIPPGTPIALALTPTITKVGVQQAEKLTADALTKAGMRVAAQAATPGAAAGGTGSTAAATGGAAAGGVSMLGLGLWGFLIFVFFAPRGDYVSPELLVRIQTAVTYAASQTKTKTKPALAPLPKVLNTQAMSKDATCVSKAKKLSASGCNFVPIDPVAAGGLSAFNEQRNPQASEYCREFTGNEPCEYWLYPSGGGPGLVQEWARFDGYDGSSLIECKCGYDDIVEKALGRKGIGFEQRSAQGILDAMIREVRNHLNHAGDCDVPYRMVVSSNKLKAYLISQGVPEQMIEVRESELCD